jgi:MFS family permease
MTNRRWYVLALLGLAFLMTTLDSTILIAALPSITAGLRLHPSAAQWVLTGYAIPFGGLLLLCGRAADLFGRRRMFLTGVALRIGAAVLCGLAGSGGALIAGRLLQGLSAGIIAPAALSMVTTAFPEGPERNKALGIWGGLGGVGATAGLLLGGFITDAYGWQMVFFLNVPVCVLVLAVAPALLTESRGTPVRSFDLAGAAAITGALALLILAVVSVPTAGWLSLPTLGSLAGAAVLTGVFGLVEARSAAPLVPPRIRHSRSLVGGNLLIVTAGMCVDGMLVTLTGYVQRVLGWSAGQFGLLAAVMTVTSVAGLMIAQRLITRLGVRPVAAAGALCLAVAALLLSGSSGGSSGDSSAGSSGGSSAGSIGLLAAGLLIFGAGMGGAFVAAQIAAFTGVAEEDAGLAAGLIDTSFSMGCALGVAICTSVVLAGGPAGYRSAFGVVALFALAGLSLSAPFRKRSTNRPAAIEARD